MSSKWPFLTVDSNSNEPATWKKLDEHWCEHAIASDGAHWLC
jgi:hypothetical protein